MMIVVDATDQILGRMASLIAKRLLDGESVAVVNSEKALVTGNPTTTYARYRTKYNLARVVNPSKGPFFPRMPDRIVSRTVRGMLPFSKPRGKAAYRLLRVYRGVPDSLKDAPLSRFQEAGVDRLGREKYTTVGEISLALGAKREAVF